MPSGRSLPHSLVVTALAVAVTACGDDAGLVVFESQLELPAVFDLGEVYAGTERTFAVEVANEGARDVALLDITVSGAGYTRRGTPPARVPAGAEVEIPLRLLVEDAALGLLEGRLTLATDQSPGHVAEVALRATAVPRPTCDDENPCTLDGWEEEAGACRHDPREGACDDGNACTEGDFCVVGTCVGELVSCDDGVACTLDTCDRVAGCLSVPDDASCADDDGCTLDRCQEGACVHLPAPDYTVCGDQVLCQSAQVCLAQVCTAVPIPEGAPCGSEGLCSSAGVCSQGSCSAELGPAILDAIAVLPELGTAAAGRLVGGDEILLASTFLHVNRTQHARILFNGVEARRTFHRGAPSAALPLGDGKVLFFRDEGDMAELWRFEGEGEPSLEDAFLLGALSGLPLGNAPRSGVGDAGALYCSKPLSGSTDCNLRVVRHDAVQSLVMLELETFPLDETHGLFLSDRLVLATDRGEGLVTPSYTLYREEGGILVSIHSFAWNPDGISAYGNVETAAVSSDLAVIDLGHAYRYFVVEVGPASDVIGAFPVEIPALPSARLLALVGRLAYFSYGGGIHVVDFADPAAPVVLGPFWLIDVGPGSPNRLLDVNEDWLLVAREGRPVAYPSYSAFAGGEPLAPREPIGAGPSHTVRREGDVVVVAGDGHLAGYDLPTLLAGSSFGEARIGIAMGRPAVPTLLLRGPTAPIGLLELYYDRVGRMWCPSVSSYCFYDEDRSIGPTSLEVQIGILPQLLEQVPFPTTLTDPAGRGCLVAGMTGANQALLFDRCGDPTVAAATLDVPEDVHGFGPAIPFFGDGRVALLTRFRSGAVWDVTVPGAPQLVGSRSVAGLALRSMENAVLDGDALIMLTTDFGSGAEGPRFLERLEPNASVYQVLPEIELPPAFGYSSLVGQKDGVAYLSVLFNDEARLVAVDMRAEPPSILAELTTPTPVQDLDASGEELVFAREDGLFVLQPACLELSP